MVDMKEIKDSLPDEDDANDPDVSFQTHHLAFIAAIGRRKVPTKIQPPRTSPDRPTVPPKHSQFAHVDKAEMSRPPASLATTPGSSARSSTSSTISSMSSGFVELHWKVRAASTRCPRRRANTTSSTASSSRRSASWRRGTPSSTRPSTPSARPSSRARRTSTQSPRMGTTRTRRRRRASPTSGSVPSEPRAPGRADHREGRGRAQAPCRHHLRSLTKEDFAKEEDDEEEEEPIGFAPSSTSSPTITSRTPCFPRSIW